jgi:hypothetical protein
MNIFTRFFSQYYGKNVTQQDIERDLIRRESEIGRTLFGPIPKGLKRDFFCLDETTWVWHEEQNGTTKVTRYLIKSNEIVKSVNGGHYERISVKEAENFQYATQAYAQKVDELLYNQISVA